MSSYIDNNRTLETDIKKGLETNSCPNNRKTPQVGLEPTTYRLTAGCSAIELLRIIQPELCQDILEVQQNYYNNKIFFYKHIFLLKLVQTAYFLKKLTIVKITINGSKKGSNSCSSFKRQNKR